MDSKIKIFIDYHEADVKYFNKIKTFLQPLQKKLSIKVWDKSFILPGRNIQEVFNKELVKSQIIILLISAEYLASENFELYFNSYSNKLKLKQELIPVLVSHCQYRYTKLSKINIFKDLLDTEKDRPAFTKAAEELCKKIELFIKNRNKDSLNSKKENRTEANQIKNSSATNFLNKMSNSSSSSDFFFEDVIIELAFYIDPDNFYTGFLKKSKFLLPIKKEYFKYFSFIDLKKQLIINITEKEVKVCLNIPTKKGEFISFNRKYNLDDDSQVIRRPLGIGFNLGIFPFYQVVNEEKINKYCVGLVKNIEDLSLTFYKLSDIKKDRSVHYNLDKRTRQGGIRDFSSEYYHIDKRAFDCIEVEIKTESYSSKGLIIPLFKKIKTKNSKAQITYAIDLEDSYTHIAFMNDRNPDKVSPFSIEQKDRQMLLLSSLENIDSDSVQRRILNGAGGVAQAIDIFDREFLPSFIGEDVSIKFPIKTAICEHNSYQEGNPKLFSNLNIGFGFDIDDGFGDNEYYTNLKHMFDSGFLGKPKERMEYYIKELLWLIKNKSLLDEGSLNINIYWLYFFNIKRNINSSYSNIWKEQLNETFGKKHKVTLKEKTKPLVSSYAILNPKERKNFIGIDIGNTITRIIYNSENEKKYFSTSFAFAGNDIWGEGLTLTEERYNKDNGFLVLMVDLINSNPSIPKINNRHLRAVYDSLISRPTISSKDICKFLFKYDKQFNFSDIIRNHKYLPSIFFIHLTAILFHLTQILREKNAKMPENIFFSGEGSNYLHLIGSEKNFQELVETILEELVPYKMNKLKVSVVEIPKEINADGAINEHILLQKGNPSFSHLKFKYQPRFYQTQKIKDIANLSSKAETQFNEFLQFLENERIKRLFMSFDIKLKNENIDIIKFIRDYSLGSYNEMRLRTQDDLEESLFFWYFKDVLYPLSKVFYKN